MKEIITCFKLIRYGKKATMNIVMGIIFVGLFLILFPASLIDGGDMGYLSAFMLMEGAVFLTQPSMSLSQRGVLSSAPVRRTAEIFYQPLCLVLPSAAGVVYCMLTGAAAIALGADCAETAVYQMTMILLFTLLFISVITSLKMNFAGYIITIIVMAALLVAGQGLMSVVVENIMGSLSPMGTVFAAGGVCVLMCFLIGLLGVGLCRLLYKRNYGKYVKQMLDMGGY